MKGFILAVLVSFVFFVMPVYTFGYTATALGKVVEHIEDAIE